MLFAGGKTPSVREGMEDPFREGGNECVREGMNE